MTVAELRDALQLKLCVESGDLGRDVTGCYIGDLLSWVMGKAPAGSAWLTVMQNANVAAVAMLADVSCVLLVESVTPDRIVELASGIETDSIFFLTGTGEGGDEDAV